MRLPRLLSRERLFTNVRLDYFRRWVLLPLAVIYAFLLVLATARNAFVGNDEYAAVLVADHAFSNHDYWVSPCAFFGAAVPWTFYFNDRGLRIKWLLHAKRADLESVIGDPRCSSIVLIGHGSRNCWQATDRLVTNDDVKAMAADRPKKPGEWLQLTCGLPDGDPVALGELVMESSRVYGYGKTINIYALVADAFSAFRYLKHAQARLGS